MILGFNFSSNILSENVIFSFNMPTRVVNKGGGSGIYSGDGKFLVGKKVMFREGEVEESESSSSIGKNSDVCENSLEKCCDGEEVQSSYKGPLDAMEALEEVLPIRRGISRLYKGKSKSFASLGDASSIKDISKPEDAYMRKRRNKARIAKRVSSRTTLALAVAITNAENGLSTPPKDFSSWRSFSCSRFPTPMEYR